MWQKGARLENPDAAAGHVDGHSAGGVALALAKGELARLPPHVPGAVHVSRPVLAHSDLHPSRQPGW
jgi:hypothetical protein